ncbi:MAG: mechanosensitive ion channel family protein, partial [Opitutales bacterium]
TVRSVAFVLLTLFLLQNLFGFRIGSLLAGLGVIGLGISLAAQGVLKNTLGAFNIFINKPFLLGDWIQFDRSLGAVEDVGLYATKVRLLSGELLTVPNMRFIDEEVENLSERQYLRREMNVAIPYDTPRPRIEKALRLLGEVLGREEISEAGHFQRAPEISFSHYGDYFLNLRVYYWYYIARGPGVQRDAQRGWFTYLQHSSAVNLGIKQAFDEAGIEFAFPSETHFLTDDPARGLVVGDRAGTQEGEGEGAE